MPDARDVCQHAGLPVFELQRVSVGDVCLQQLGLNRPGMSAILSAALVNALFASAFSSEAWPSVLRERRILALEARLQRQLLQVYTCVLILHVSSYESW